MAEPESEVLTVDEMAAYMKPGKRADYCLATDGRLSGFKMGEM